MSAHSATQVQEAGGRGGCGKDHRGYAGGALLTWDSANSAIGGGCSANQSFFSHLGKRRLRFAPGLPRLVEAVLQVAAVPLLLQLHARRELHVLPLQLSHLGVSE